MSYALRALLALGAVLALEAFSGSVRAESRATIVLVAPDADERIARRLRAELEQLGFQVVDVPATTTAPDHRSLEEAARTAGAFAAVRIEASDARVEVWIADRVTGKTVLREVVLGSGESPEELVAVRTVELLRASLAELELPQPVRGDVPARPDIRALVPAPRTERLRSPPPVSSVPAWQLELGPATALSPGGLEPRPGVWIAARSRKWSPLRIELFAMLPAGAARVEGFEGSADVSLLVVGGAVSHEWRFDDDWVFAAGTGLAGAYLRMRGEAQPPLADRTAHVVTAVPLLLAQMQYSLGGRAWVGVDLRGGLAVPRPVVGFAGRKAATWGRPLVLVAAVFALDFG